MSFNKKEDDLTGSPSKYLAWRVAGLVGSNIYRGLIEPGVLKIENTVKDKRASQFDKALYSP